MKFEKEEIIVFIKQNIKTIVLALVTSIIIGSIIFHFVIKNNEQKIDSNNYELVKEFNEESPSESKEETKKIFIDIKGAVKNPGVYELEKDNRIKDVLDMAGGLLEDADTSNINLSQKVTDQMLIIVPKIGEKIPSISNNETNSKIININTATKEQLMNISGVGETKAKAIIDYRENKGQFSKKEDIMKVKGIGKGTFEKIKDEIEV
ncbi:helix-hairpin-helix domain-containing protein [Gemella sp. GH3]|uniref:helix-hairpin-helix domain-containing protein n=1 Tax=unclassified Gemella TaxID=2624949 RepID=UPI0015D03A45|nr:MULTISPECIES: helix-hairpin-helix domain-containing protein [unclassified Gemella]MBF0713320.1 helix-hairpin-helix domain-containing protein [Gemella sp. GH3.1]NYS50272.1 helix-hairpin-helix domain-containing protein [Gemella sp. GH3]